MGMPQYFSTSVILSFSTDNTDVPQQILVCPQSEKRRISTTDIVSKIVVCKKQCNNNIVKMAPFAVSSSVSFWTVKTRYLTICIKHASRTESENQTKSHWFYSTLKHISLNFQLTHLSVKLLMFTLYVENSTKLNNRFKTPAVIGFIYCLNSTVKRPTKAKQKIMIEMHSKASYWLGDDVKGQGHGWQS